MPTKTPIEPSTLSEARIKANRENAKKSTGPTSAAGKARSSRNRLTHGMRAKKHILLDDDNPEDFLLLLNSLDTTFRPVGDAEEMLVLQIAADQWRLDRALPMEAGIFRQLLPGVAAEDRHLKKELLIHQRSRERDPEQYAPAPDPPDPGDRLARAFMNDSQQRNHIASANRYRSSAQLSIDRSLRQLKIYQAARTANAPTPGHQPSPPTDHPTGTTPAPVPEQPVQPAEPAATPQKSADYHSNPPHGNIAKSSTATKLLALLALLQALPELIAALAALLASPRAVHKYRRINTLPARPSCERQNYQPPLTNHQPRRAKLARSTTTSQQPPATASDGRLFLISRPDTPATLLSERAR